MNLKMISHGLALIVLAPLVALFVPDEVIPRLSLSAHGVGILSGALLIVIGLLWGRFDLSVRQYGILYWSWLYAGYVNWLGCLLGAVGSPFAVGGLVAVLLVTAGMSSLVAFMFTLWGLRSIVNRLE